ncbi:hypothetical protein [Modestobacter sp. KNN46-3]|uniref:hypothetical protein n=1 Tax=Modestobacter sp. KNN46-3 TaxID=2711218 RepID=UPI0013E0B04E|nr:hypothetical protein [Modestobacter sp. KNN46-3]
MTTRRLTALVAVDRVTSMKGLLLRIRRLFSAALVGAGLSIAVATPAHADHVLQIVTIDGEDTCRLGGTLLGSGVHEQGRLVQRKVEDGVTTSYRCQFRGISAEDGEGFVMPRNGLRLTVPCWLMPDSEEESSSGSLRVTPSGNATVDCR